MIWPLSFVAIALVAALTILIRSSMQFASEEKARQNDMVKTWHPCANAHKLVIIDVQLSGPNALNSIDHSMVLRRCSHCELHFTTSLAGHWTMTQLLRKESEFQDFNRLVQQ